MVCWKVTNYQSSYEVKRIWAWTFFREKDNDSDAEFEMQGQALPVAPFDVNKVDTTVVPLTSQEYLQQVMYVRTWNNFVNLFYDLHCL